MPERAKATRRILQTIVIGTLLWFVIRDFSRNWQNVAGYDWRFDVPRLVVSLAGLFGVLASMVPIWRLILGLMGHRLPMGTAWRIWFVSNLGKYVPGKIWQVTGMVLMCERAGVPKRVTAVSVVLAQALSTLSGLGIFGAYILVAGGQIGHMWGYSAGGLAVAGILVLHPRVLEWAINLALRAARREPIRVGFTFWQLLKITGLYLLSWCGYGLALYLFMTSLAPLPPSLVWVIIPIHAAAYTAGLLVLLVPGGIGVRESILALFLGFHLPQAVAISSAWLSRIWFTVGELVCLAIAGGVGRPGRPADPAEHEGDMAPRAR